MKKLWAKRAFLPGGFADGVLLEIGSDGRWANVTQGVLAPPHDSEPIRGLVLPGLVNAHSHAFQRAFVGLAERREADSDDFWSWRDRMYGVALRISNDQLHAVAAHLYAELVCAGYTQVCEFHYLHHAPDGTAYADPLELSWALADAAAEARIGLTMLPVLYERAGFAAPDLRDDQRRFHTTPELVFRMSEELSSAHRPLLNAGIAIHSLRAASAESVARLRALWAPMNGPVHIHVAEQMQEVNDCLESTGERPVAWLSSHGVLDERVQLVHATHTEPDEIAQTAQSGAGVVLCPSTEANLGDGLCDLPGWLAAEVPLSLGSDSHVTRSFCEELRLLEYGQRLAQQKRNVSAAPEQNVPATAERLYARVLAGGGQAAGFSRWGLARGARADALVVDGNDSGLRGIPLDHMLDALVFASPVRPFRDVMVAGEWVVKNHVHTRGDAIARRFSEAMAELFA